MAAERKEVVVNSHAIDAQLLAPDMRKLDLDWGLRRHVGLGQLRTLSSRRRQSSPVQLTVWCQRKAVEEDHGRRNHVGWQPPFQKLAQLCRAHISVRAEDGVGDDPLVAGRPVTADHNGLVHGWMFAELGLDFPDLDSESANLYLFVQAAEKLDAAIGQEAAAVPGPIESRAGVA